MVGSDRGPAASAERAVQSRLIGALQVLQVMGKNKKWCQNRASGACRGNSKLRGQFRGASLYCKSCHDAGVAVGVWVPDRLHKPGKPGASGWESSRAAAGGQKKLVDLYPRRVPQKLTTRRAKERLAKPDMVALLACAPGAPSANYIFKLHSPFVRDIHTITRMNSKFVQHTVTLLRQLHDTQ